MARIVAEVARGIGDVQCGADESLKQAGLSVSLLQAVMSVVPMVLVRQMMRGHCQRERRAWAAERLRKGCPIIVIVGAALVVLVETLTVTVKVSTLVRVSEICGLVWP